MRQAIGSPAIRAGPFRRRTLRFRRRGRILLLSLGRPVMWRMIRCHVVVDLPEMGEVGMFRI